MSFLPTLLLHGHLLKKNTRAKLIGTGKKKSGAPRGCPGFVRYRPVWLRLGGFVQVAQLLEQFDGVELVVQHEHRGATTLLQFADVGSEAVHHEGGEHGV